MTNTLDLIAIYKQAWHNIYSRFLLLTGLTWMPLIISIGTNIYWLSLEKPGATLQLFFIAINLLVYFVIAVRFHQALSKPYNNISEDSSSQCFLYISYLVNVGLLVAFSILPLAIYTVFKVILYKTPETLAFAYLDNYFILFFVALILTFTISLRLIAGMIPCENSGLAQAWQRTRSQTLKILGILSPPLCLVIIAITQINTVYTWPVLILHLLLIYFSCFFWLAVLSEIHNSLAHQSDTNPV